MERGGANVDADGWYVIGVCLALATVSIVAWAWASRIGIYVLDRGKGEEGAETEDYAEEEEAPEEEAPEEEPAAPATPAATAPATPAQNTGEEKEAPEEPEEPEELEEPNEPDEQDEQDENAENAEDAAKDAAEDAAKDAAEDAAEDADEDAAEDADEDAGDGFTDDDHAWADMRARMDVEPWDDADEDPAPPRTRFVWNEEITKQFLSVYNALPVGERTAKSILARMVPLPQGLTITILSGYIKKFRHTQKCLENPELAKVTAEKDAAYRASYNAKPETKKRKAAHDAKPETKKRKAAHDLKPEVKERKVDKREAATAAHRAEFIANKPELADVWLKDKAVQHGITEYTTRLFEELGGRTAQAANISGEFVMSLGVHGSTNPKTLRREAYASLSRDQTNTWVDDDGVEWTRTSTPAFRYPEGEEQRWGPNASLDKRGMWTRPFLTMVEAEKAGFEYLPLATFPCLLNAKDGEYAVQVMAKDDLLDSGFSNLPGAKGHSHMPRMFFRAPVEVATKHELAKMAEKGAPPDLGTLFVLYAKVGDETAQAWARGERPNHIFIEKTGLRVNLNEC